MEDATDPSKIPDMSMGEFMELSLLSMFTQESLDREVSVFYKGAFYKFHMCVQYVQPGAQVHSLTGEKQ